MKWQPLLIFGPKNVVLFFFDNYMIFNVDNLVKNILTF